MSNSNLERRLGRFVQYLEGLGLEHSTHDQPDGNIKLLIDLQDGQVCEVLLMQPVLGHRNVTQWKMVIGDNQYYRGHDTHASDWLFNLHLETRQDNVVKFPS